MTLQPDSFLIVAAEIAVAFVGFASLVGVFVSRGSGTLPVSVRVLLRALLDYGLLALFACGFPLLLAMSGLEVSYIWPVSSATFVAAWLTYVALSRAYYQEVVGEVSRSASLLSRLLLVGDGASILVVLVNAMGVLFEPNAVAYCAGAVAWRLAGAALSFRALLGEIWSESDG